MKITGYNYGTSQAVPLYLSTDGANTILNSGGGSVLQPGAGYGMPKAMVFVLANGTISRCYNGITGATTNNCGFTATRSTQTGVPVYAVNFGFDVSNRFFSLTSVGGANISGRIQNIIGNTVYATFFAANNTTSNDDSDFFLIVY